MTETERVQAWLLDNPRRYTIRHLCRKLRSTRAPMYRALCSLRDADVAEKWGGGRTTSWRVYGRRPRGSL